MLNEKNIYENVDLMPADLRGWNSNNNIFETLILKVKPKTIIEVGSWKGASAINMAQICKEHDLSPQIFCVDTWLGALEFWTNLADTEERNLYFKNGYPQVYYQFLSNVIYTDTQDIITPLPLPSNIAHKVLNFHNIKADLIYIDASHEYEDVLLDIRNYSQLLNANSIIFGDDFNSWPGVERAVRESFNNNFYVLNSNFWVHEN